MVSASVRTAALPHVHAEALDDVAPHVRRRRGRPAARGSRIRATSTRPERDADGLRHERPRHPGGEQRRADRRPDELVRREQAGHQPGVADPQVLAWRPPSAAACRRRCRRTPRRCPSSEHRDQDDRDARPGRVTSAAVSTASTAARSQVAAIDDHAAGRCGRPARPRRGRTAATAAAAAAPPSATSNGSLVCEATSSGPAASRDAVAEVADPRRADQPAERRAHASREHGLDQSATAAPLYARTERSWPQPAGWSHTPP